MAVYKQDIRDVEMNCGSIQREFLGRNLGEGDALANRFGVRLFRNGEAESIGGSCTGHFIRPTGDTVAVSGTVSGNTAYVDLPQACYAHEGPFTLAIKVTKSGATSTVRIIDGMVVNTDTGAAVDPGTVIPSVDDLIEDIEEAVASIPADYTALWTSLAKAFSASKSYAVGDYVTYNGKVYRFTSAHPAGSWDGGDAVAVALGDEIKGIDTSDVLRYSAQSLTTAQKTQARQNIDADTMVRYVSQSLSSSQKTQARTNIAAAGSADLTAEATARAEADTALGNTVSTLSDEVHVQVGPTVGRLVCAYSGGYYSASGQWHDGDSSIRAYDPVPVNPGMIVSSPALAYADDYYFLFDSSMEFISPRIEAGSCPDGLVIPQGAAYCVLEPKTAHYSEDTLTAIVRSDPVARLERGNGAPATYAFRDGYYNVSTGKWTDGEGTFKASEFIPVTDGSTVCSSEIIRGDYVLFFAGDYSYLGYLGTTDNAPGQITVPYALARYAVIQVRTANNTNSSIRASVISDADRQKPIYAVLAGGLLDAAAKFDRENDFVVEFAAVHGANGLPEFNNLYVNHNAARYPAPFADTSGMTRVLNIGTDWHGPYVMAAKSDLPPQPFTEKFYTGGNHALMDGSTIVNTTAKNNSCKFYIDGALATAFAGYCENIEIRWSNSVQAYNTVIADEEGRYVLIEQHRMVFDGREWKSEVTFIPQEDLTMYTYYGWQLSGVLSVFPHVRIIGADDAREVYSSAGWQSSDVRVRSIEAYGDTYKVVMELDTGYDTGDHRFCQNCPTVAHINSNKAYHRLVYNTEVEGGKRYSSRAIYRFEKA